jgi:hypothetical protein
MFFARLVVRSLMRDPPSVFSMPLPIRFDLNAWRLPVPVMSASRQHHRS